MSDDELREWLQKVSSSCEPLNAAEEFFRHFVFIQELLNGDPLSALNRGLSSLHRCQQLAPENYETIHKGTPYYWLGVAAFHVHDYQTAVFFFDAAVSEDLRQGATGTPALHFIQIEGEQPKQAARQLVQLAERKVGSTIAMYNERRGRSDDEAPRLQLEEVRRSFLARAVTGEGRLRTLVTAFISFFLEWDYRSSLAEVVVGPGTAEPFFLHLFKGCLLFESLLKANPKGPCGNTLDKALKDLQHELRIERKINISNAKLGTIMRSLRSADDSESSITDCIEFTGKLRNTLGHDLGWQETFDASTHDRLAGIVASSCLHAIACLYR